MKLTELVIRLCAISHLMPFAWIAFAAPEGSLVLQVPRDGARLLVPSIGETFPEREVTIEFWQQIVDPKTTDHVSAGALICEPTCKLGLVIHAAYPETKNLQWGFGSDEIGGSSADVLYHLNPLPSGWHHFAFSASTEERRLRIYQNGELIAEKGNVEAYLPKFDWTLEIGRPGVQMTEYRVWNYSRTPAEVQHMFDKRAAGSEMGLILCLPLDGRPVDLSFRHSKIHVEAGSWVHSADVPVLFPLDSDSDGLADLEEQNVYETDPGNADTDSDGLSDGFEIGVGRYKIQVVKMTWPEARDDAERNGGHLATVTSSREWQFLRNRFGADLKGLALGGTDEEREGDWRWVTGEPWTFSNWYSGQPDNLGSGQHRLWLAPGYPELTWDDGLIDGDQTSANGYLLEYGYATDPKNFDSDGDGFSDGAEVEARSNPLLITDVPPITLSAYTAVELNFMTKIGVRYQIQTSEDGNLWMDEGAAILGNGGVTVQLVSTKNHHAKFYRVERR